VLRPRDSALFATKTIGALVRDRSQAPNSESPGRTPDLSNSPLPVKHIPVVNVDCHAMRSHSFPLTSTFCCFRHRVQKVQMCSYWNRRSPHTMFIDRINPLRETNPLYLCCKKPGLSMLRSIAWLRKIFTFIHIWQYSIFIH
jgi:hypothetical protein